MDITSIKIKNIKGFGDPGLDWDLSMHPIKSNKINLVVAPNGSGKSSIAIAFEYVKGPRITLQEKHFHNNDKDLLPLVSIVVDGQELKCDNNENLIKGTIMPNVINSPLIADTKSYHIPGGGVNSLGLMAIEKVEMQSTVPDKQELRVNTNDVKAAFGVNSKIIRTINNFLPDSTFLDCIGKMKVILTKYTTTDIRKKLITDLQNHINSIEGTEAEIKESLTDADFSDLESDEYYQQYISLMSSIHPEFSKLELYLYFFQLYYIFNNVRDLYYKAVKRAAFEKEWEKFNQELFLLDTTGRSISAVENGGKIIVEYPDADAISNGQRDLLTFYCRLKEFENSMVNGRNYLLLIDEIFDYLDDANYIAAQYFLTKFMKRKGANVCILLFTHLDPAHFRSTVFNESVMNVLYLKESIAKATPAMTKFLAIRQGLDRSIPADDNLYNKLSAHYFHYNPQIMNIKIELERKGVDGLRVSWGEGEPFYSFLIEEVNKYVSGSDLYDPYAVATALRLRIEKVVYDQLNNAEDQASFLTDRKCFTTVQKLHFAESKGLSINEIFFMAIPITNDADHLSYIKGTSTLDEHPLIYKMEHPVLKHIVSEIFGYQGVPFGIEVIR